MQLKVSPIEPEAPVSGAELQRMIDSPAFRVLTARIVAEMQRQVEACVLIPDPTNVHRAQGAVLALRGALALPGRLVREAQAARRPGSVE